MPSPDLSALIRWPNVPACYGWLSLDRRGRWRLQGEVVTHQGFIDFINRQYGCDEAGNWFLQNGPQRVFAALEYTPWVLRLDADGCLLTHTGLAVEAIAQILIDEQGNLLVAFAEGIGVLDDRDLATAYAEMRSSAGQAVNDAVLEAAMEAGNWNALCWRGMTPVPVQRAEIPSRFGFIANPEAA